MGYFLIWLIGALVVAFIGSNRKIGFGMAFLWSILLSPVIGLIITLVSPSNLDIAFKEKVINSPDSSLSQSADPFSELEKGQKLLESGAISIEEFNLIKARIIPTSFTNKSTATIDGVPAYEISYEKRGKDNIGIVIFTNGFNIRSYIIVYPDLNQRSIHIGDEEIIYSNEQSAVKALYTYLTEKKVSGENLTHRRKSNCGVLPI